MKKLLTIFCTVIILVGVVFGLKFYNKNSNKIIEENQTFIIQKIGGLYFFELKKGYFDLIFEKSGSTAKNIKNTNNGNCAVINGGYFGYLNSQFAPAGGLIYKNIESQSFTSLLPSESKLKYDPNLGVSIKYDQINNSIYIGNGTGNISFNAGPMMVEKGKINTDLDKDISHRKGKYRRTFMIINHNENSSPILGFTDDRYTLKDLVSEITNSGYISGNYSIVNLDGGPSTSFSSRYFQYNENQKLPWYFIACEN